MEPSLHAPIVEVDMKDHLATRPLLCVLADRANLAVVAMAVGFALLLQAFVVVPLLLLVDLLGIAGYLAAPSRRADVLRRMRHKRRAAASMRLRCADRLHWIELEETVRSTGGSLPASRRHELEQLLDLYVEVGLHAARWESQIERFGRLPAAPAEPLAPLVVARSERRTRANRALETLTTQLATVSTLVQLGCEDAIASRVWTAAGDVGAQVEEARRSAQLAIEASEEVNAGWNQLAPLKA
jgi:hypothetical protein